MSKLYSSRHIITVLDEHGFVEVDQSGSNKKFRCGSSTVIVPLPKREIPYGTFMSILRQSGLKKVDFE
jgi:predicted RNA binding protein YcfA (HicA-like mRNA interferase family)